MPCNGHLTPANSGGAASELDALRREIRALRRLLRQLPGQLGGSPGIGRIETVQTVQTLILSGPAPSVAVPGRQPMPRPAPPPRPDAPTEPAPLDVRAVHPAQDPGAEPDDLAALRTEADDLGILRVLAVSPAPLIAKKIAARMELKNTSKFRERLAPHAPLRQRLLIDKAPGGGYVITPRGRQLLAEADAGGAG